MWADSLPAEPQGKPKNTGVGSLSLLQWIFSTQESNRGLLHCRQILYQLSYQRSPKETYTRLLRKYSGRVSDRILKKKKQKTKTNTLFDCLLYCSDSWAFLEYALRHLFNLCQMQACVISAFKFYLEQKNKNSCKGIYIREIKRH